MSGQIFISYRREDASHPAGRLCERLSGRFPGRIFMDVDNVRPGEDFVQVIKASVSSCDALVAVIGVRWLESDSEGKRRVDDPDDFVRLEIPTRSRPTPFRSLTPARAGFRRQTRLSCARLSSGARVRSLGLRILYRGEHGGWEGSGATVNVRRF